MTPPIVLTVAALTLQEASRRRVLWALAGLTVVLLALSAWGFSRLAGFDRSPAHSPVESSSWRHPRFSTS